MSKKDIVEYATTELEGVAGHYYVIPASIVLDAKMGKKRASIYSYFSVRKGLDNRLSFSINAIVDWLRKKPNRNQKGINTAIRETIAILVKDGYLEMREQAQHTQFVNAVFNKQKLDDACEHDRFAVIYIDELEKILSYSPEKSKDTYFNTDIILLVFAYLRMKIYRRRNRLFPEEINIDNKNDQKYDIEQRRLRSPDAYDCYYKDIAEDLGISARAVSKATVVLDQLELIYAEELPRVLFDTQWTTDHTVFCNMYKREGSQLLTWGESYYLDEVANKKKKLKQIRGKK